MKKTSFLLFFCLSIINVFSQEAKKTSIYLSTGTVISGKLISATDENITFSFENGSRTLQRVRVLIAFNEYGRYLFVNNISDNIEKSKIEINDFYNLQTSKLVNDIIFKAVPFEIISCKISYERDVVNYINSDGKPGSVNKDNVLAIIRKDGSHDIVRDIIEVAPVLGSNIDKFKEIITPAPLVVPPPVVVVVTPKPETIESKPTPSPVIQEPLAPAPVVVAPPVVAVVTPKPETMESRPTTPPAIQESLAYAETTTKLSNAEKEEYSKQATYNVLTFKDYLNRIGDKGRSPFEKRQDIKDALELFTPDATIEVTSKSKIGSRKYPIAKYLTNLSNLNYSSIEITYANLRFVSELNQAADGNYYGIVRGEQTFKGMVNGVVKYGDVVDKNYKIKVESFNNIISGKKEVQWKVLLGDVSVSQ